jgi:DNA-binding protein HU-beta
MTGGIEKRELVSLVSERTSQEAQAVNEIVDAFLDEIYQALKRGDSVSLRGFGSFYVRPDDERWEFRFNPSQRLRALPGGGGTARASCGSIRCTGSRTS